MYVRRATTLLARSVLSTQCYAFEASGHRLLLRLCVFSACFRASRRCFWLFLLLLMEVLKRFGEQLLSLSCCTHRCVGFVPKSPLYVNNWNPSSCFAFAVPL